MKLTFLGTNGWFSDEYGNTVCTLLETEECYIVFDAGDGIRKLEEHIESEKPIYLFLSHLHIDHIVGFHILSKFQFKNDFKIFCMKGAKKYLDFFINHPFTNPISKLKLNISIEELEEGVHELPVKVECKNVFHMDGAFGYSIFAEEKKVTYLCDTGVCDNSKLLAKDSDIVIHECSMKEGVSNDDWGHTSSIGAALVAKEAGAKKLILTHMNSAVFPKEQDRHDALNKAKEIFEDTTMARDDLNMSL